MPRALIDSTTNVLADAPAFVALAIEGKGFLAWRDKQRELRLTDVTDQSGIAAAVDRSQAETEPVAAAIANRWLATLGKSDAVQLFSLP